MQSEFYKIYINLTQDAKSKNDIEINFEKAIEYAKDSEVCKGGKYNIHPRYSYNNGKRKFLGYNGSLAFNCTFKDEKIIEEFLTDIEKIDELKISQGQMQPTLSEEQKILLDERLEKQVYTYAKEYVSFLDDQLDVHCKVSKIEFQSYNNVSPVMRMEADMAYSAKSVNITKPIDSTGNKSIRIKYTFSCEN
jgi:predicted secreted protein